MNGLACSFTGHREIESGHRARLPELLLRAVYLAYEKGVRRFYNGGAYGFDLMAARAVLLAKLRYPDISLHIIVPCQGQSDKWSSANKQSYEYVLSQADTVDTLSEHYYQGCMHQRNSRLVELSDLVIAYVGKSSGGSYRTLALAHRKEKSILNLYPVLDGERELDISL